ncbi:MAG: hypothetical protein K2X38_06990 [Gemmataceae bacterium]|nr:hypothetical protein [Gemmataceae bacterium]
MTTFRAAGVGGVFLCIAAWLASAAFAQDQQNIVGRWDVIRAGKRVGNEVAGYMRFEGNGTFTSTLAFLATTDGKYRFVSNRVIELDFPGVIFGRNKSEFVYELRGETLKLSNTQLSIDLEFKRLDSGK